MRRIIWFLAAVLTGVLLGSIVAAHNALVIPMRPAPDPALAEELARATDASWERAAATAEDGAALEGWVFTPRAGNGAGAIVLHGVGDMRHGMLSHARFLLRAGYTVLAPDARGHGASGGGHITYGVLEARDVHKWADWLKARRRVERLYGLGVSMGAAVLIQSLAGEPRFRAIVAESPFATFEEIAYDRVGHGLWPVVKTGFAYARLRYGVDLRRASPVEAARGTSVPVLLIHGDRDRNIGVRHSRAIHAANPVATRLWVVPGADHVQTLSVATREYVREVVGWFQR